MHSKFRHAVSVLPEKINPMSVLCLAIGFLSQSHVIPSTNHSRWSGCCMRYTPSSCTTCNTHHHCFFLVKSVKQVVATE